MELLRADARKATPWKNGGGFTSEVAVYPKGASLESFGWRISTAVVAESGPFSIFKEIDRTLLVLTGEGLSLKVGGAAPTRVTCEGPPISFRGDAVVQADLLGGPVTDLNVMARRGSWRSQVRRCTLIEQQSAITPADVTVVLAVAALSVDGTELLPGDAVMMFGGESPKLHSVRLGAKSILIELWRMR